MNPCVGECKCASPYCYVCLVEEVVECAGQGWKCLRCGEVVKTVNRWGVQEKSQNETLEVVNEKQKGNEKDSDIEEEVVGDGDNEFEDSESENLFTQ